MSRRNIIYLVATLVSSPALAGSLSSPWDRPEVTAPQPVPAFIQRICGEEFEKVSPTRWIRLRNGQVYTLSQRVRFGKKCKVKPRKKVEPIAPYFRPRPSVPEKPEVVCRRVEHEGQTPRFTEECW